MRTTYTLAAALAGLALLAACQSKTPDESLQNNAAEAPAIEPVQGPPPDPSQNVSNTARAPANMAEPPAISEEQQMLDDADATGLTSRLPDENDRLPPSAEATNRARANSDSGL